MSLKKTISTAAALAMSVSAFAGFAVTANAAGELSGSYSTASKTFTWSTGEASGKGTYSTTDDDKYADLTIVSTGDYNTITTDKGFYLFRPALNGQNGNNYGYLMITPTVDGTLSFDVDVSWTSGNTYTTDIYVQETSPADAGKAGDAEIVVSGSPSPNTTTTVKFNKHLTAGATYYIYSYQYYYQRNATNFYNISFETDELVIGDIEAPEYTSPDNAINIRKYSEGGLMEAIAGTFDFTNQINTSDRAVSTTNIDFCLMSAESNVTFSFDSSKSGSNVTGTSVKIAPDGVTYVVGSNEDQTVTENVSLDLYTWYRMTVKIANRTSPMSVQISDIASGESKYSNDDIVLRNAGDLLYRRVNISSNGLSYLANIEVYNSEITYKYMVDNSEYAQVKAVEGLAPTPPENNPEKDGFTFKEWVADEEDATVFNAVFEQVTPPEPVLPTASVSKVAESTTLEGNAAASYMATFESDSAFKVKGITWTVTKNGDDAQTATVSTDLSGETTIQTDGSIVFGLVIEAGEGGLDTIGSVTAELK